MKARIHSDLVRADPIALQADSNRRLVISLDEDFKPSSDEYNLLMGFHFGAGPTRHDHPAIVSLRLQPIGREQLFESWWYKGEIKFTKFGSVRIAECQDYTVAIVQKKNAPQKNFRAHTRQAYRELLAAVRSTKHSKMVKVWNYFDDINTGDNDSEKYRQFSIGRAEVFQDLGISDQDTPCGTAIGTLKGSGISLIALASNQDFCRVENPRQVSAFHYPRIYGPSTPKFSRGGFVSSDSHKLYLISGTAAVVGHETAHPFNTRLQTTETFKNLDALCHAISNQDLNDKRLVLDEESVLHVYLRNPEDYYPVADKIYKELKRGSRNVAFLHGNICRRELMVEIDGVKVI